MTDLRARLLWAVAAVLVLDSNACRRPSSPPASNAAAASSASTPVRAPVPADDGVPVRDLQVDESMGGHTLARYVGKTDAELADRLRREPQISSASTYTDRATAERAVGAALESSGDKLAGWRRRSGRRPNLVIHYVDRTKRPLGRSLARGRPASRPSDRVLVVLRWDERSERFFVLSSYPEVQQ